MNRTFVQLKSFADEVDEAGISGLLESVEREILKNPESGDVVQGTGGVRKLRVADKGRGKGKRGGFRVLYLDLPRVFKTYLLVLYGKGTKDDISAEERSQIALVAAQLKRIARE